MIDDVRRAAAGAIGTFAGSHGQSVAHRAEPQELTRVKWPVDAAIVSPLWCRSS